MANNVNLAGGIAGGLSNLSQLAFDWEDKQYRRKEMAEAVAWRRQLEEKEAVENENERVRKENERKAVEAYNQERYRRAQSAETRTSISTPEADYGNVPEWMKPQDIVDYEPAQQMTHDEEVALLAKHNMLGSDVHGRINTSYNTQTRSDDNAQKREDANYWKEKYFNQKDDHHNDNMAVRWASLQNAKARTIAFINNSKTPTKADVPAIQARIDEIDAMFNDSKFQSYILNEGGQSALRSLAAERNQLTAAKTKAMANAGDANDPPPANATDPAAALFQQAGMLK